MAWEGAKSPLRTAAPTFRLSSSEPGLKGMVIGHLPFFINEN